MTWDDGHEVHSTLSALVGGTSIKQLSGIASTNMSDTPAERTHTPTPEGSARAGLKLHEFFKHLEGELGSDPSEGAERGRVSRIRGLLSGELEDVEFKIMDEDTKRDVKRFVKR